MRIDITHRKSTLTCCQGILAKNIPAVVSGFVPAKPPTVADSGQENGSIVLRGSILDILRCIADGGAQGVEDDDIAIMTNLKTTSRNVYKRQLAASGYISREGERCFITQQGIDAMGGSWQPLPKGAALREYWLSRLTGGELQLFKLFVEYYPAEVSTDNLMNQTGLKTTSINVYKRKLRARRLLDGDKASAGLFG